MTSADTHRGGGVVGGGADRAHRRQPAVAHPEVYFLPGGARVQVPGAAGAGTEQEQDLGIVELPQLLAECRGGGRPGERARQARERPLDVRGDQFRQMLGGAGIVERLVVQTQRLQVERRRDRGRPRHRAGARLGQPPGDGLHHLRGVRRGAGDRAEESVQLRGRAAHDVGRLVRDGVHGQAADARLGHHRFEFLGGPHLEVGDEDIVDAGVGETLHLGADVGAARNLPLPGRRIRSGELAQHRPRHVQARPVDDAFADPPADAGRRLQRRADVARAGHARLQELARGDRHQDALRQRAVGLVPAARVGMAEPHQGHLHVPEAGQHRHPLGRDDLGAVRDGDLARAAHGEDAVALDHDDAVRDRRVAVAVDHRAAGQHQGGAGEDGRERHGRVSVIVPSLRRICSCANASAQPVRSLTRVFA
jgi:hypothetical protein